MKVIQSPRGSGKTQQLILELCRNPDTVMVTHSERERKRLQMEYPLVADRIVSFGPATGRRIDSIVIDNLDLILYGMFPGVHINSVSLTKDD